MNEPQVAITDMGVERLTLEQQRDFAQIELDVLTNQDLVARRVSELRAQIDTISNRIAELDGDRNAQ